MPESAPNSADPQLDRARDRLGCELAGKWRLEQLLGMGGMASVYRACHKNGLSVAIKILHLELLGVAEARERFLEEAFVANRIEHPGTIKVLDDGLTDDGAPYLVMDFLEGQTLEEHWQGSPVGASDVIAWTIELLEVVRSAHASGVVHRDIKPENVFLTKDGKIKLLDFGIAKMDSTRRTTRTQLGSAMGTPAFMPPEQARGRWEEVDERSDLWAVGATMFSLLSGRTVHEALTTNELLLASMTIPAPPLATVMDVSPRLAAIVDRALEFDANLRFVSADEMLFELRRLTDGAAPMANAYAGGRPSPRSGRIAGAAPQRLSTFRPVAGPGTTLASRPDLRRFWARFRPTIAAVAAAVLLIGVGVALTPGRSKDRAERAGTSHDEYAPPTAVAAGPNVAHEGGPRRVEKPTPSESASTALPEQSPRSTAPSSTGEATHDDSKSKTSRPAAITRKTTSPAGSAASTGHAPANGGNTAQPAARGDGVSTPPPEREPDDFDPLSRRH